METNFQRGMGDNKPPADVLTYPPFMGDEWRTKTYQDAQNFIKQPIDSPSDFLMAFETHLRYNTRRARVDSTRDEPYVSAELVHVGVRHKSRGKSKFGGDLDYMKWGRKRWVKKYGIDFVLEVEAILLKKYNIVRSL